MIHSTPVRRRFTLTVLILIALFVPMLSVYTAAQADDACATANADGCSFGLPTFQYQLLLSQILAHPSPNVRQLQVDSNELLQFSFNKLIGGATPL